MRVGYGFLLLAAVLLVGCATLAHAADPVRKGKIAAPPEAAAPAAPWTPYAAPPEVPAYKTHNWYVGGLGGYSFTPDSGLGDVWSGSVIAGYLWRPNAVFAAGLEAEYMVRDLGHFDLHDGVTSVRGRAGVFMAPGVFVYGAAGVAQATNS